MARDRATDPGTLVRAAAETFQRKGYHNATIDDIAEAAGISRPTVYKYTKSKQDLLDSIVEHVTESLGAALADAISSDAPPLERLRRVIDVHVASTTENHVFYAILFSEEIEASDVARKRFRHWAHEVTSDFESLVNDCLESTASAGLLQPRIAANLVVSMLTSLYRWYDPRKSISPSELSDQILRLLHPSLTQATSS